MPPTSEAFSRVHIDAQLRDQGWDVLDVLLASLNAAVFPGDCGRTDSAPRQLSAWR